MYTVLKKVLAVKKVRRAIPLVPSSIVAVLAVITLLALLEQGSPSIYLFQGASPASIGMLGTTHFVAEVSKKYPKTHVVFSLSQLNKTIPTDCKRVLYIDISPEIPYTMDYAKNVIKILSRCKEVSILIADEYTTSNPLLEVLNLSVRISGEIIRYTNGSPYVEAFFELPNGFKEPITLDIASFLQGYIDPKHGYIAGYVRASSILIEVYRTPKIVIVSRRVVPGTGSLLPVAVYHEHGKFRVFVIGDGSIFLNQVFESPLGDKYRRLAMEIVDTLCGEDRNCIVVFEGSRYRGIPIEEALRDTDIIASYGIINAIPLIIAKIIHPATWVPTVVDAVDRWIRQLLAQDIAKMLALVGCTIAGISIVRSRMGVYRDRRIEEVIEFEAYSTSDIRSAIVSGRYRFSKEDLVKLYMLVDSALRSYLGISLDDPRVVDVLSNYVEREKVVYVVDRLRKLYRKATRGGLTPVVLSWHRAVSKLVRDCEELLNVIGTSILSERGIEYAVSRV